MGQLGDSLDDEAFRQIRQRCTRVRFGADAYIFHAGEAGDTLYIIDTGHVAVLAPSSVGEATTVAVLGPGDTFGELALVGASHRRSATIQTLTTTEVFVLSRAEFEHARRSYPAVDRYLIDVLATQVLRLTDRVSEATALPAAERIFRRLIEAARAFGVLGTDRPVLLTQAQLASMAGASLRAAQEVLGDARKAGIIAGTRRRLVVLDWAQVYRRARLRMT